MRKLKIIFLGRRPHSIEALQWLLERGHEVTRVVAPSGSGKEVPYWSPRLRDFALARGLRVVSDTDIYDELEAGDASSELHDTDLVVSFLFWKLIKAPLIDLPRYGCINFHPAPLPDYKGLAGYNFAILDQLPEWGASVHYVDATFDTGSIIQVDRFAFDWRKDTAFSLERATRPVLVRLLAKTIARVEEHGELPVLPNLGGRYINRSDMEDAKKLDIEHLTADDVDLRVRAFWYPPFEGAYIEKDGQRFTLVTKSILRSLTSLHDEAAERNASESPSKD